MKTYTTAIKELKGYNNTTVDCILNTIAIEKNFKENEAIQYRKLFYGVIRPELSNIKNFLQITCAISRRQFKKTYFTKDGRVPLEVCVYYLSLYIILKQLNKPLPTIKRYSDFIAKRVFDAIELILQDDPGGYTQQQLNEFRYVLNKREKLDELVNKCEKSNNARPIT